MKVIISIHVLRNHFQHKIKLAAYIIALYYLVHFLYGLYKFKPAAFVMLLKAYIANNHKPAFYFGMVNQGGILFNYAAVLHAFYTLVYRRGAKVYRVRYLLYGYPCILLQQAQYRQVFIVQCGQCNSNFFSFS